MLETLSPFLPQPQKEKPSAKATKPNDQEAVTLEVVEEEDSGLYCGLTLQYDRGH